ncbi:MAG: hypothetical protein AAGN66_16195 [Acidobacteriota bacterium]
MWIQSHACATCGSHPPSEASHVRTRGAGGEAANNIIPQCKACHRAFHLEGCASFQIERGLDLQAMARRIWREWSTLLQEPTTR